MFDIGFSELIVCAIVALVVIGPERMPEAVRTVGLWVGRLKRSLRETRSEIERQIGVDDIRRQLHNEEIMRSLEDARRDMDNVISQTQHAIDSTAEVVTREYKSEPDLPYHSHMEKQSHTEEQLHTEPQAPGTTGELPKLEIDEKSVSQSDPISESSHAPFDKKTSL